jgi:hypothetical protein
MTEILQPVVLRGRPRYERVMEGWIDDADGEAFTHTVRLHDPDRALEVAVVALPSPAYTIRAAECRPLAGAIDGGVMKGFATLGGVAMVGGLTRRAAEAVGGGEGAALAVDALVEVARLARQATRLPRERAERAAGDAWACWQLDTTGWVDLPNSCFTYSDAGRALFATRAVTSPMQPDLYSPRPGQRWIFERRKVARLERSEGRLSLFHSMHDNAHGFELRYEIDLASGTIVVAEHVTPRLPYMRICSEPQARIAGLGGQRVDGDLRRRLGPLIGGSTGCAQFYDLTADLLKLLS